MDREQRKVKAEALRGREVRRVAAEGLELREVNGQLNLAGWASVTDNPYDMGWYTETIRRGAFAQTLTDRPDVQLLINHEGLPLARTVSGTLRLAEDQRGLHVDADLDPNDPDVERLAGKVQRGDIDQMSFAFSGARSEWDEDFTKRDIVSLSIHRGDVSVVNFGANPATSFNMRSLFERLTAPTDSQLEELRGLLSPEDMTLALATLQRLAPAPVQTQTTADKPPVLSLDLYRARNHAGRSRPRRSL